jgi:predicted nuclease of restriction endonuclease-like RecB superfamily
LLPLALTELCIRVDGTRTLPRYFTERDWSWISALLAEYAAFQGEKRSRLRQHLREPLPLRAPHVKLRVLRHLFEQLSRDRLSARIAPREARWLVFRAAAGRVASRAELLAEIAASRQLSPEELEDALFADLDGEKLVAPLPFGSQAHHYVAYANRAILASLLARAVELRIFAHDAAPALVRRARRLGLICGLRSSAAEPASDAELLASAVLEISGPLSLFRRTHVYARALAALLPPILESARFELEADCRFVGLKDAPPLFISSDDPIGAPAIEPAPALADRLLARFVADFSATVSDWELSESHSAWVLEGKVLCPDFELVHRSDPEQRWFLQIVRSWTRRSLEAEAARTRALPLLLCVDEQGPCEETACPPPLAHDGVLFFRRRLEPERILSHIEDPGRTAAARAACSQER